MRILHVNHTLDLGGTEVMMLDLAREQKLMGEEVTICSMYGPGKLDEKAAEYGIPVVHLESGSSLKDNIRSLTAYLERHPQNIVHSHWGTWLATAISGFLKRTPRVHTHHANQRRRLFLEHRTASLFTNRVAVLTPQVDDYIRKWVAVPKRKIVVIPNGINASRLGEATPAELPGIPADAMVVGMVARLSPPKDYPTYMRAAKLVLEKHPEVHFLAVGEGQMRSAFEAEAAQMGLRNFHFLGARLDVPQILRRMTISVLATKNEGLSITLLEGMTSGCACIASDIPANRFALDEGRCGLLVPNQDPAALAEAIERLLYDPELRAGLQQKAKERAASFTSRRMAERYIELYRTLQPGRR